MYQLENPQQVHGAREEMPEVTLSQVHVVQCQRTVILSLQVPGAQIYNAVTVQRLCMKIMTKIPL